jgi:cytochrome b561
MNQEQAPARYGAVAIAFHWLIFGLVAVMFTLAWKMFTSEGNDPSLLPTILLHKSIGITVLTLAVLRIIWRQLSPPPPLPPDMPALLRFAAVSVHGLLYVLLVAVPILGWLTSSAAGITVKPFGLFALPNLVTKSKPLFDQLAELHETLALTLLGLITLHVLAGLFHHFIRRDAVLPRMIPFIRPPKA